MEQVAQKFVTIRWADANHLLPPDMQDDITMSIGSKRQRNGRDST